MSISINNLENYINKTYIVAFKGDGVKKIEDANEIVIGEYHGDVDSEIENVVEARQLISKGDAMFIEGLRLFTPYADAKPNQEFDLWGWDYIENGANKLEAIPEYWEFVETDILYKIEGIQKKHLEFHPKRHEYYKKAKELWEKRQDSLLDAIRITGYFRDVKRFINPCLVYKKTVLLAGLSHVVKNKGFLFEHSSVQKLHDFLKPRNAVILVPKERNNYLTPILSNHESIPVIYQSKKLSDRRSKNLSSNEFFSPSEQPAA